MPKKNAKTASPSLETQIGNVRWIDVHGQSLPQLKTLQQRFPSFIEEDIRDCLPSFQRPKLLTRHDYLFLVLLFPFHDEATDVIHSYEVDFFIGKDYVVTSHKGTHPVLSDLRKGCGEEGDSCPIRPSADGLEFAVEIVHRLTISCYPLVTRVSGRLGDMEEDLFNDGDIELVKRMLRARSNIVTFRKAIQGYEHVVHKLGQRGKTLFPDSRVETRLADIAGHGREISSFLDNDKDTIDALYDSHLAYVNFRTSEASRKLTALAFVVLPMTLVAAIFTTHATHGMPFIESEHGFWIINAIILLTGVALMVYLVKRKWL